MSELKGFANVVFPARDLGAGVAAWKAMLGREPAFVGEDFAAFSGDGVEVGLTALPWVDHPLVFWKVDDVEREVAELKARGVVFEEYDMPGVKMQNSIASGGGAKTAWFKDSEGNILAVSQRL